MPSREEKRSTRFNFDGVEERPSPLPKPPSPAARLAEPKPSKDTTLALTGLSKRKASPTPALQGNKKSLRGEPRKLALVETSRVQNSASQSPILREESPWDTFSKVYECDLAGSVAVVVRRTSPTRIHAIRQFASSEADEMIERVRCLSHENIMRALQCFHTSDMFYMEVEHFPLTLDHIIACRAYPDERQLAVILTQVLHGLSYLIAQHLKHDSLNNSSILMDLDGRIQIARLEDCRTRLSDEKQKEDVLDIARVTMELMQKYTKDEGAVGVENLDHSIEELKQHPLVNSIHRSKGELVGLTWFALITARTFYSFDPQTSP